MTKTDFDGLPTDLLVPKKTASNRAADFLQIAASHMGERASTYDQAGGERSAAKAANAFNIITGHTITEAEAWLFLQLLKDVRQWQNPAYHADSAEDCVAYAALKAEALANG